MPRFHVDLFHQDGSDLFHRTFVSRRFALLKEGGLRSKKSLADNKVRGD
jgi:hypothetical protein